MDLPIEIINKILLYNIHPVAELLKPIFILNNNPPKDYIFDGGYLKHGCWDCHKIYGNMICLSDKYFCDSCWEFVDPNDEVVCFSTFELLEMRMANHFYRF